MGALPTPSRRRTTAEEPITVHHGQSRGIPVATASRVRPSPPLSVASGSRRPSDPSSRPRAADHPAATANPAPAAGGKPFLQAMPTVTEEAPPPLRAVQMEDVAMLAWDCLNRDDDDEELLRLLGNQTPLRDCHAFLDIGDITCEETLDPEESREPKRRRVLEYPSEVNQPNSRDHEIGSNFVTSEVTETSLICTDEPQSLNWDMQQDSDILDMISSLSNGSPYEPSDNQLENYSDGATVYYTPDQMTPSQESVAYMDYQTDMPGSSEIAPATENLIMQETSKLSMLKVSKGGSSMIKMKRNLTTFMTCPFTLIKPYWEEGNITLKDINQLIHAPPKQPPEILGMSAFSGKPVIGKTRIRTEGGKGSITILRTKG